MGRNGFFVICSQWQPVEEPLVDELGALLGEIDNFTKGADSVLSAAGSLWWSICLEVLAIDPLNHDENIIQWVLLFRDFGCEQAHDEDTNLDKVLVDFISWSALLDLDNLIILFDQTVC